MRYETFRDRLEEALQNAGVAFLDLSRKETIELACLSRTYEITVGLDDHQRMRPFFVTAKLGFCWNPFQSARSYTTEEDLVVELFGRKRLASTRARWQRVDMTFLARLPYGSKVLTPDSRVLSTWRKSIGKLLARLVSVEAAKDEDHQPIAAGWRGEVEVREVCSHDGSLVLEGFEIAAFQIVNPPRASDNPDKRDHDVSRQLEQLARRFQTAFGGWMDRVGELGMKRGLSEHEIR